MTKRKCIRCGYFTSHGRDDCPAMHATCNKCKKLGHYASECRTKSVRGVAKEENDFLGSISLGNIKNGEEEGKIDWQINIKVTTTKNSRIVNFRLDTGADVTVVPDRFFRKNSIIKQMDRRLYGPGQNKIKVIGKVDAALCYREKNSLQELYIVKDLMEPLLGGPAIKALNLLSKINSIEGRDHQYKKIFSKVFTGLGKLKHVYKIHLDKNAQPFSITTPRRLALPMKQKVQDELKRLESEDIRPIEMPTDWCAPIVAVPKKDGKIRLCLLH